MKREELKELGLTDEQIEKTMSLHGKTVNDLNQQLQSAVSERDSANEQLKTNQTEFNALREKAKGNEELSTQLAELQTKYDQSKTDSETKLAEQSKDYAIKLALKEANALDENIILGLLDKDTIKVDDGGLKGFTEQLNSLKESKSFLFQQEQHDAKKPNITVGGNPQAGGSQDSYDLSRMSYEEVARLKAEQPETFRNLTQ
ncbi:capsid protein [Floricoccus tropicus]|uniref:Capsid protein n=1 Tax=Floricoccus tropicus TaxID=1859473 RepID=A0A1E8GMG0_9LACT|nr:phage scaffolding protein [Floricoccus tropicus]OFI48823.1 capsid protein [Floricoccus tropicus]